MMGVDAAMSSWEWGKTRTKIPDGAAIQVGSFPPLNGNVDLEH